MATNKLSNTPSTRKLSRSRKKIVKKKHLNTTISHKQRIISELNQLPRAVDKLFGDLIEERPEN